MARARVREEGRQFNLAGSNRHCKHIHTYPVYHTWWLDFF